MPFELDRYPQLNASDPVRRQRPGSTMDALRSTDKVEYGITHFGTRTTFGGLTWEPAGGVTSKVGQHVFLLRAEKIRLGEQIVDGGILWLCRESEPEDIKLYRTALSSGQS